MQTTRHGPSTKVTDLDAFDRRLEKKKRRFLRIPQCNKINRLKRRYVQHGQNGTISSLFAPTKLRTVFRVLDKTGLEGT
jgi:uncharacterized C2H2 Zn-finger protein